MSERPWIVVELDTEQFEALARRVAELLAERETPSTAAGRWLTTEEAAAYIGARPQRIFDLRSSGRLSRTGDGSRVLVDRHELDRFIECRDGQRAVVR